MWAAGQNLVGGHVLKTYNASGGVTSTNTFASDVPGGANQSTILLATAGGRNGIRGQRRHRSVPGQARPGGRRGLLGKPRLRLLGQLQRLAAQPRAAPRRRRSRTGWPCAGRSPPAAPPCWSRPTTTTTAPPTSPPSSRRLARTRSRPASAAAPAAAKAGSAAARQGSSQKGAPQTTLRRKPGKTTRDRTPTFRFASDEPGSTFQCKLDGKPFRSCRSPFTTKRLTLGRHTFKVRARDDSGKLDPSPASYGFKVVAKK